MSDWICRCGHAAADHDLVTTVEVVTSERHGEISRTTVATAYPCLERGCPCDGVKDPSR